jgi:ribosomal protein S27AE
MELRVQNTVEAICRGSEAMSGYGYEGTRRVGYSFGDEGVLSFVPVCPKCGRFVKADLTINLSAFHADEPNATCGKCGRVVMPTDGFVECEEAKS